MATPTDVNEDIVSLLSLLKQEYPSYHWRVLTDTFPEREGYKTWVVEASNGKGVTAFLHNIKDTQEDLMVKIRSEFENVRR